jgi:hypothetical protein
MYPQNITTSDIRLPACIEKECTPDEYDLRKEGILATVRTLIADSEDDRWNIDMLNPEHRSFVTESYSRLFERLRVMCVFVSHVGGNTTNALGQAFRMQHQQWNDYAAMITQFICDAFAFGIPISQIPHSQYLLGGNPKETHPWPPNVTCLKNLRVLAALNSLRGKKVDMSSWDTSVVRQFLVTDAPRSVYDRVYKRVNAYVFEEKTVATQTWLIFLRNAETHIKEKCPKHVVDRHALFGADVKVLEQKRKRGLRSVLKGSTRPISPTPLSRQNACSDIRVKSEHIKFSEECEVRFCTVQPNSDSKFWYEHHLHAVEDLDDNPRPKPRRLPGEIYQAKFLTAVDEYRNW